MGHTRWATHGAPTDENAHPHLDCAGRVAVIHNGIVENHQALRASLEKEGHAFASETDTEVVAHLVEAALDRRARSDRRGSIGRSRGSRARTRSSCSRPATPASWSA